MEVEQDSAAPERIGGFRILRRLATGGTADVLLARAEGPLGFERVVVLKVLLDAYRADPDSERMFAREASAYARLSHPGIVKLYDFFLAGDQLVMVLEFVDGLPLNRLRALLHAQGAELDDRAATYLASRIFSALAAAHSARDPETAEFAPVIHRDVNPSNVLLPWDGHVKLADFGIAKVTGMSGDTKTGFIKGTFGYMAPEQVKGEAVSVRADVYAGSLLLWELLAHRKAIQHNALPEMEVLRAMAHPNIVSLDVLRPDLPAVLRNAVARGLEPQEAKRSITADEMVTILRSSMRLEEGRAKLVETLAAFRPHAEDAQPDTLSGESLPSYADDSGDQTRSDDAPPTETIQTNAPFSLSDLIETTLGAARLPAPSLPRFPDADPTETKASPRVVTAPVAPVVPTSFPPPRVSTIIFGGAAAPRPVIPRPGPPSARPDGGRLGGGMDGGAPERAPLSGPSPPTVKGVGTPAPAASAVVVPSSRPGPVSGAPPPYAHVVAPVESTPAFGPPPSPLWSSPPPALSDPYASTALDDDVRVVARPKPRRGGRITAIIALVVVLLGGLGAGGAYGWHRWGGKLHRSPPLATRAVPTATPPKVTSVVAPASASATAAASVRPFATVTGANPPPPASITDGTLTTSRSAAGHRVFVDGKLVGQGTASFRVACGRHTVKVGSSGPPQSLDVPCGGEITAQ
jgi:serine/threonine protein kinase